jgi:Sep-tRNA:Cys-tRNA synthetase
MALMASFPHVRERVKNWNTEVENARYVVSELEKIGLVNLGVTPAAHDVRFFESEVLYKISENHKDKNFYLYNELKKRGIVGIKAGLTKNFNLSTYGKTPEQIKHLVWAFQDIIQKFGK